MTDSPATPQTLRSLTPRGVTWLGLSINILLAGAKISVGLFFASKTLFVDGLHSGMDLVSDVGVLAAISYAALPASGTFPYGRRRVGTLMALAVGLMLVALAVVVAYRAAAALHSDFTGGHPRAIRPLVPFIVAIVSIGVKEGLFRITHRVAKRHHNMLLEANAWHHRSDAFSSLAAAIGLGGVLVGGVSWQFLDPAFAIVMSALLLLAASRILIRAARELIDHAPDKAMIASIEQAMDETDGVAEYHAMRARTIGGLVMVDVHVQVAPALTVRQGHDIAGAVKGHILTANPQVMDVVVHIEPAGDEDA